MEDGRYKNNVITRKVALRDEIEEKIRAQKAIKKAEKYKSKQNSKTILEETKELEQKKKSSLTAFDLLNDASINAAFPNI